MKRSILMLLVLAMALSTGYTQKSKVTSALNFLTLQKYENALDAIMEAEQHEKSKDWFRTYYGKGRVLQAIAESGDNELIKRVGDNILVQAYDNYMKAIKMDDKGKIEKEIDLYIASLSNDFINKGVDAFNNDNFKESFRSFEYVLKIGDMAVFQGSVDTSILYNAALAALNAKMYDEAITYFDKTIKYGYAEAMPYILMKNAYLAKGDSVAALGILQKGFEKYSDNENIMIELINYYLISGGDEEAMKYLDMAIENNPENFSFYYARGVVYDKRGDFDNAVKQYNKSLELNPEDFNTNYNMGALHFNQGVALANDAIDIIDNNEYLKAKAAIDKEFSNALPYMEKAHEVDSTDVTTMETLKTLYYRLQMMDKHKAMVDKLENR